MIVYLVRHAHAVGVSDDPERPLSKRGRRQVRTLASFLHTNGALRSKEFWHSPLARAQQTAALLVRRARLKARLVDSGSLLPTDDPRTIAGRLRTRRTPLVIVGHEPHLSALASLLIAGAPTPRRFHLKKCAALALERAAGVWAVAWQISPDLLE